MTATSPRIRAVRSAFLGKPTAPLEDAVEEGVRRGLPSEQKRRLDAALSEQICVFPERLGLYRVRSPAGERGESTEYTIDMKYSDAKTCTCGDFMYRLEATSGQMCKHIWRATILVNLGVLPDPSREPYDWLLDELARDVRLVGAMEENGSSTDDASPTDQLRDLKDRVANTHRIAVEYPQICTERADILSQVEGL